MKITIKRRNKKKHQTTYRNTRQFTEAFNLGVEAGVSRLRDKIKELQFDDLKPDEHNHLSATAICNQETCDGVEYQHILHCQKCGYAIPTP